MLRKIISSFLFPKEKPAEPEQQDNQVLAFNRQYGYSTSFGHVIVSWSRHSFREPMICTVVGFAMAGTERASSSSTPVDITEDVTYQPFSFVVNPTFPRDMLGLKNFVVMNADHPDEPLCNACFAWDFSGARCLVPGSVEPSSNYYFAVVVHGEMMILLGDMPAWAHGVTQVQSGPSGVLISRMDRVKMKETETEYKTSVAFGGVERKILIKIERGMLALMFVKIDGKQVVAVPSVFKMFRGMTKFDLPNGNFILITWDLHDWLFGHADDDGSGREVPVEKKRDGIFTFSFIEPGVNAARKTCPGKYVNVMHNSGELSWWKLVEEWVSSEEERMHKGETFWFSVHLYKD